MVNEILEFWFKDIEPSQWWVKDDIFDQLIRQRFLKLHTRAERCECFEWRNTPEGRLAEIIILDQFSRNMFRGSPRSFANDPLALALAQEAVSLGADQELSAVMKSFLYMPYMHSESSVIHGKALELFSKTGLEGNIESELRHKAIIDRFGRYPHRNEILARESTPEELEFLKQKGSRF